MNHPANVLQQLIDEQLEALIADWRRRLRVGLAQTQATRGESADEGEIESQGDDMRDLLVVLRQALGSADGDDNGAALRALDALLRQASQVRAARGLAPESSVLFVHAAKDALLALLRSHGPADAGVREQATLQAEALFDRCVITLVSQFVATREDVIRRQAESLLDMATPVITLWDSILLLPLVGIIDSVRAVQIAERLLEAIGRTEAEITLIDVTGVPVMDTSVARHLLRTVAAAEMLGTRVVLTGISPTTAQTMVKLGIDLSSVPTRGSLKAGVALALTMTGRQVLARAGA